MAAAKGVADQVLTAFRTVDPDGEGTLPKRIVRDLLRAVLGDAPVPEAALDALLLGYTAGDDRLDLVNYRELVSFVFDDQVEPRAAPCTLQQPLLGQARPLRPLRLLSWNIQSPAFASNPLEFVPPTEQLPAREAATWEVVRQRAIEVMFSQESRRLGDLIENPLEQAGEVERARIDQLPEKQVAGLQEWLDFAAPGIRPKEWLEDLEVRWKVWQDQTVCEFLRQDYSGGKPSKMLEPANKTFDSLCWDLGLSSADRAAGKWAGRWNRSHWLARSEGGEAKPSGIGKFDFFKLLIWDLVVAKVLQEVSSDDLRALVAAMQPRPDSERMQLVVEKVKTADIAVLMEVPDGPVPGGLQEDFWEVRAEAADAVINTVILARKALFEEPLPDSSVSDHRLLGCTLVRKDEVGQLHILGVHVSSSNFNAEEVCRQLEQALRPCSIVAGDFNSDIRSKQSKMGKAMVGLPKLGQLLKQALEIPEHLVSTCKERSPFQAQVSKALMPDVALKDFVLLGSCFLRKCPSGMVTEGHLLPDAEVPSDHAPLEVDVEVPPQAAHPWFAGFLQLQKFHLRGLPISVTGDVAEVQRAVEMYARQVLRLEPEAVRLVTVGPGTMSELLGGAEPADGAGQGLLSKAAASGKWLILEGLNFASVAALEELESALAKLYPSAGSGAADALRNQDFQLLAVLDPGGPPLPQSLLAKFGQVEIQPPGGQELRQMVRERLGAGVSPEEQACVEELCSQHPHGALLACDYLERARKQPGSEVPQLRLALQFLAGVASSGCPLPQAAAGPHAEDPFAFLDVCRVLGKSAMLVSAAASCTAQAALVEQWAKKRGVHVARAVLVGANTTLTDLAALVPQVAAVRPAAGEGDTRRAAFSGGPVLLIQRADLLQEEQEWMLRHLERLAEAGSGSDEGATAFQLVLTVSRPPRRSRALRLQLWEQPAEELRSL